MRISKKFALVYLLTLVPLVALGLGLLSQWYSAHLALIEDGRLNNARLVATAFETFARDLGGASRALGETTLRSPPDSRAPARFNLLADSFPLHFSAIVDPEGRVMYADDPALLDRTIEDTAVAEAIQTESLALGVSRELHGDVGFVIAQALFDPDGTTSGVAVQFVDPERLARRLANNPLAGGGASIVDESGTLVVLFERPEAASELQFWGDEHPVSEALEGREAVDRDWIFPLTGERRIGAAVPIEGFGWEASSAISYDVAVGPFIRSLSIAAGVGLLFLIMSGTASLLMARSLLGSVAALREQSLIVADRDREPAEVVTSGDELEEVSRVLRRSDLELRSYISGLEAIGEAGRTLSAAIGAGDVDNAVVRASRDLFGASVVWVLLWDERTDMLETQVWFSVTGAPAPETAPLPGRGIVGRVFSAGQVQIITDVSQAEDRGLREVAEKRGVPSLALVPLERAGRPYGVLGISAPGVEGWTVGGRDVALLRAFGNEVSTVLENARLYDNERMIADTLQQSLLAIPDSIAGITFAHAYHAATQMARVGGDFYDLFEIERRTGIVMGDVAGHGLDAAVLTSLVKNAVRAHSDEPGKAPSEVIELTNELVVKESRPEVFVTLFVSELDHETDTLVYCNAGHTTGALLRRTGEVERLGSTAMLVGAFPGVHFEQASTVMAPGDTLLLYTDGLTEARQLRLLYGESRLFELLGRLEDRSPAGVVEAVLTDVMEYTGGELSDDLAVLAVQRA